MNISQRLRTCAKHTGLDAVIELLNEAADEIDALQARAQVHGEPVLFIHPATFSMNQAHVGAWKPGHELPGYLPLYTAPQAVQATQAEVMDADIVAVMRDGNNCNYNDEAEHIQFARAILAMRPVQVPMTDEEIESLLVNWPKDGIAFFEFARAIESNHGITAQAKKEDA